MVHFDCPRVIHHLVSFTFVKTARCPFLWMQEKGNAACGLLIKWKFITQKSVSWIANGPI